MSNPRDNVDDLPQAVVEGERKGIAVVWLLPLVALLAGGWLVVKTLSERGPEIVISFETAEGIEEGKTKIKYKDVKVGTVSAVNFSDGLSQVLVNVTMVAGVERFLTDKTRFWVVRPRVGLGEVSGLDTLVSGVYIAVDPDDSGAATRSFTGLETPPVITTERKGTSYRLRAERVGSLSVGSPVYYRQFSVGEVTDYRLSDDHQSVEIGIFIESPHDGFVREGSTFWNASGVDVSLDASGVNISMESVVSLMGGGIAFETLPVKAGTPVAAEGHSFTLFPNHTKSLEQPITQFSTFALKFDGTVRGLEVGAPVEFRGIRIGTVKGIELGGGPSGIETLIPVVVIDIEPQRMQAYNPVEDSDAAKADRARFLRDSTELIRKQVEQYGLRARLQTGNLLTGKLFVDFDFYPEAPAASLTQGGRYPEIPTMPNSLEGIVAGIQQLLNKLEKADLAGTLENLNRLMRSTGKLMAVLERDAPAIAKDMRATLADTRSMLQEASHTLKSVNNAASPEGEISVQLQEALQEVSAAARSIRVMAEYLERHPDAMLKGKSNP